MTTIIKCKMCGGTLEVQENETVARCKYCGSLMTLPKIDNEKKARLFNRANQYRLDDEFDRAYEAYKAIAAEDIEEPEAYWGMLLSEYGIEYVEDPQTGKRKPTCHRTIPTSIKNSSNFKLALQYADAEQKMMYEDEAEVIDEVQRRILSVSSREEPYDVFICYKDTNDFTGERTTDSVLAQDIYNELSKLGIKTFFSRVTLEDKLGVDYEPYIYAALKSARVMLVVTEDPNNCNSVWVKNEWMRFLNFMKEDSSKVIIPVYQKITAYDLPSELSRFQSQDMSKIGAIQDLVHGIERLLNKKELSEKDRLLNQLIEEKKAQEEQKKKRIEAENKRKKEEAERIEKDKAEREKKEKERLENQKRKQEQWKKNRKFILGGIAVCAIVVIGFYIAKSIKRKIDFEIHKDEFTAKYQDALSNYEKGDYSVAYTQFSALSDYEDSEEMAAECQYMIALQQYNSGDFDSALSSFERIENYKDSKEYIDQITQSGENAEKYQKANQCMESEQYLNAIDLYSELGDYLDSESLLIEAKYEWFTRNSESLSEKAEQYYNELLSIEYKDIRSFFEIREKIVAVRGKWIGANSIIAVSRNTWGQYNSDSDIDNNDLTFTYSYSSGNGNFTFWADSLNITYTAILEGDSLTLTPYRTKDHYTDKYSGIYKRG